MKTYIPTLPPTPVASLMLLKTLDALGIPVIPDGRVAGRKFWIQERDERLMRSWLGKHARARDNILRLGFLLTFVLSVCAMFALNAETLPGSVLALVALALWVVLWQVAIAANARLGQIEENGWRRENLWNYLENHPDVPPTLLQAAHRILQEFPEAEFVVEYDGKYRIGFVRCVPKQGHRKLEEYCLAFW